MFSKQVIKIERGIISPPKYSRFNSSKVGSFKIRAEMSVHKPTAIMSALLLPTFAEKCETFKDLLDSDYMIAAYDDNDDEYINKIKVKITFLFYVTGGVRGQNF